MIPHWPTTFDFEGNKVKLIYLEGETKPYYNATTVAQALGLKNASNSALSAVDSLVERVKRYCELTGKQVEAGKTLKIANSVRVAEVIASDGLITVLKVAKSNRATAHFYYYYNQEALYEVLLNSNADEALRFRYWITHEVVPSIVQYGEYIGVRKNGIDLRRCLTDSVKRQVDAQNLDEKAYATVTDVVYRIRYGLNTYSMRNVMNIDPSDNVREFLPKDELHILGEIEAKVACLVDIGMPLEDIATNPALIKIYRKPL